MWENKDYYNGLSVLPYAGYTYKQAPFEDCSKEDYEAMLATLKNVDLSKIVEVSDETDLSGELACLSELVKLPQFKNEQV
jgi:ribonucleoside-diphosphate reductase alpha chain